MARFLARAAAGLTAWIMAGAAAAGCGQISASGAGAGSSGRPLTTAPVTSRFLCADPTAVSQVQVARIPSVAQLGPSKPGQNRIYKITVTDQVKARELARAICSLPPARHSATRCPVEFGGGYQLRFSAVNQRLPLVTIEATGCQHVTGVGRLRLARAPGFWAAFGQATGIQAPAHSG